MVKLFLLLFISIKIEQYKIFPCRNAKLLQITSAMYFFWSQVTHLFRNRIWKIYLEMKLYNSTTKNWDNNHFIVVWDQMNWVRSIEIRSAE